jgi:phosphoenolpyruvate synthase/pyruvate phosphate dikinase
MQSAIRETSLDEVAADASRSIHRCSAEMAEHGLVRGERGLEVYVMCEIPSNVILARGSPRCSMGSRSARMT